VHILAFICGILTGLRTCRRGCITPSGSAEVPPIPSLRGFGLVFVWAFPARLKLQVGLFRKAYAVNLFAFLTMASSQIFALIQSNLHAESKNGVLNKRRSTFDVRTAESASELGLLRLHCVGAQHFCRRSYALKPHLTRLRPRLPTHGWLNRRA